jgi:hypothetical protein
MCFPKEIPDLDEGGVVFVLICLLIDDHSDIYRTDSGEANAFGIAVSLSETSQRSSQRRKDKNWAENFGEVNAGDLT